MEKDSGSLVTIDSAEIKGDEAQNEAQLEQQSRRKAAKERIISFKVTRELVSPRKTTHSLQVIKPISEDSNRVETSRSVCLMEESVDNQHALHIMHKLNHKNILSMDVLAKNKIKSEDTSSIAVFVEFYSGKLWSVLVPEECVDNVGHVPSPRLQHFLRDIVIAIDFLRENKRYHGNLSWKTTLYADNVVKLAGFKTNDSEVPEWNDWLCFIKMLEDISERIRNSNEIPSTNYFIGNIESLIDMLKTLDRESLLEMKGKVLQHLFFFNVAERVRFFSHDVSLKLKSDPDFQQRLRRSDICLKPWDKNCTPHFKNLVKKMNDHREVQEKKRGRKNRGTNEKGVHYDGDSLVDYVRCVCGAYKHRNQIGLDVDDIIRENHPTICVDMKRVLSGTSNSLASGKSS